MVRVEAELPPSAAPKGRIPLSPCTSFFEFWRDVRVVEGARLEGVCARESTGGSNPPLSVKLAKTVIAIWRFVQLKRVESGDSMVRVEAELPSSAAPEGRIPLSPYNNEY